MLENVHGTSGFNFRTCEIDGPAIINNISSPPSQFAISLFATKANTSLAQKLFISTNDITRLEMQATVALEGASCNLRHK